MSKSVPEAKNHWLNSGKVVLVASVGGLLAAGLVVSCGGKASGDDQSEEAPPEDEWEYDPYLHCDYCPHLYEVTFYLDEDGDGYGVDTQTIERTMVDPTPEGYATVSGDCDDTDPLINPGEEEVCDGVDNDCSGDWDDTRECRPEIFCDWEGRCEDCCQAKAVGQALALPETYGHALAVNAAQDELTSLHQAQGLRHYDISGGQPVFSREYIQPGFGYGSDVVRAGAQTFTATIGEGPIIYDSSLDYLDRGTSESARAIASTDELVVVGGSDGLEFYAPHAEDVAELISSLDLGNPVIHMAMEGDLMAVGSTEGLHLVDISVPTAPLELGFVAPTERFGDPVSFGPSRIALLGDFAAALTHSGVHLFDIRDPTDPQQTYFFGESLRDYVDLKMMERDDHLYLHVIDDVGLTTLRHRDNDCLEIALEVELNPGGEAESARYPHSLEIAGDQVFVATATTLETYEVTCGGPEVR